MPVNKFSLCTSITFNKIKIGPCMEYLGIDSTVAWQPVSLSNHLHDILRPMQTCIVVNQPVIQQSHDNDFILS